MLNVFNFFTPQPHKIHMSGDNMAVDRFVYDQSKICLGFWRIFCLGFLKFFLELYSTPKGLSISARFSVC